MKTDEMLENESADYKLGYEAGWDAGRTSLKDEIESGERGGATVYGLSNWGMLSDKEVRNLVEFAEQLAISSVRADAARAAAQRMAEEQEAFSSALYSDAHAVLESVLGNTPDYKGATPQAVTNLLETNGEV